MLTTWSVLQSYGFLNCRVLLLAVAAALPLVPAPAPPLLHAPTPHLHATAPRSPCLPPSHPPLQDPNNPKTPEEKQIQENYNHAAVQIAFVAGCFYTAIGVLRLG